MLNLDVKKTTQKIKKTKPEVKKELEESITKTQTLKKKLITVTNKDAVKVVQEFEEITKSKSDIIWLVYHQDQIF